MHKQSSPIEHLTCKVLEIVAKEGLSQAEFARRMQVTQSAASLWFKQRAMPLDRIRQACAVLDHELVVDIRKRKGNEHECEQPTE